MTLVVEENLDTWGLTQTNNPISKATEPFKERAFCIVWDEMKAKLNTLWLNEEDISIAIYCENNIDEILELIDKYFPQLQELKELIKSKYLKEYWEYRSNMSDMSEQEFDEMLSNESKNSLKDIISWHRSLKILFSKYPWKIKEIYWKWYWADFMHLLRYSSDGEKYKFDWNLAIDFFELAQEVERKRRWWEDRYDLFDLLCDTYDKFYEVIKNSELFNDLLKLSLSSWYNNITWLLRNLANLSNNEIEKISKNYELFVELWILAWKNNDQFLRHTRKLQLPDNENKKNLVIAWWKKLWEDFFYIYENPIVFEIAKNYPEKYIEFCENIKKLVENINDIKIYENEKMILWVSYQQKITSNEKFYTLCLKEITNFVLKYENSWDFLYKSAKILWKYSLNVMWTWIKFLEVLYTKFPKNYEEILQKTLDLWKKLEDKNDVLFFSSGLDFLSEYLEKYWEERFFEMVEKMVELSNKYLTEESNWAFYSQKEEPISYWLWFLKEYLKYFPGKYDEILEKVLAFISVECNSKINKWENYFLWMSDFIHNEMISTNPKILDNLLVFFDEFCFDVENINLVFDLIETDFNEKNKDAISNILVWLLQNNQNEIIPFIKLLFVINDLSLKIDLSLIFDWEINNEKLQNLKKEVRKKLKRKIFFQNNKGNATYDETIQEVFWERIDKKLKWFEKVPEEQRKRNIKKLNKKQLLKLFWYWIEHEKYDKNHRTLVLYYRAENMDTFQFSLITHILYKFINWWYSKVFDRILVTSRWNWQYPHEIHNIWDIQYQYNDFTMITNIFANTIHFTHGTVIEDDYMNTTTHIVWIANLADSEDRKRVPESWNYIPLHLKYWKTEWNYKQEHFEMDKSWNFEDLFDEIIKAVKACEEKMLENANKKPLKI